MPAARRSNGIRCTIRSSESRSLFSARRLRNRLNLATGYLLHKTVLAGGPVEITIESTARCNLYCPMCPRHIYSFDNENMDVALFRKIIQDCKSYVEFVWPYGIGEPLIHPAIFDMIRIARQAGVYTGLSTNATLLDRERAGLLLDSGLDYAILAFDGATKESYEKYRSGATFEKTRENIIAFLAEKQSRRSPIHVVVQMVMLRDNAHEVGAFRRLWSIPGVDEIRFKRDEVRIGQTVLPQEELKGQRRNPCHLLWRGPLYVRYDGSVHPCCYKYDEPPIGDLKTQSVAEVWNSAGMVKLREAHLSGDLREHPKCLSCQAPRPSRPVFYGSLIPNSLAVRKAVPVMEKLARFYKLGVFEKN